MKIKKFNYYLSALALTGMILSCESQKKQDSDITDEFDEAATELEGKMKDIIYNIPPPSEIPFIIQATGAEFNPDMVNPLGKSEKYSTTNKIAALNLGVYSTDIGYLITYERVQDALNYMDACLDLGEFLGVQNAIDHAIVQKFENNLNNRDSLASIINNVINDSESYLRRSERDNIAALVLAGTFIEGLYIATQLVDTYPEDLLPEDARNLVLTPLIKLIIDQEEPLADMINLLKSINDKGDWIEGMINSLEELKSNYESLNIQEQISNNRADLVLTNKTLERITQQINKVRTTVTY